MVVGIVLAAGASTRLGRPKQTLPLGDTTVLGWVAQAAAASALDRVVAVCDPDTAAGFQPPAGVETVIRGHSGGACTHSILAGLDAAGEAEAAMLLLGDMPGVSATAIDLLLDRWSRTRPWAAIAGYADGDGHPLVFAAAAFADLRALRGDRAVWRLLEERRDRVERIALAGPRPPDIDDWAGYLTVVAALAPGTQVPATPR